MWGPEAPRVEARRDRRWGRAGRSGGSDPSSALGSRPLVLKAGGARRTGEAGAWAGRDGQGVGEEGRRQGGPRRPSRPCAMVVPDFELICEIMLVAEGFLDARLLARKFITLYTLCKELLSKQVRAGVLRGQAAHVPAAGQPRSRPSGAGGSSRPAWKARSHRAPAPSARRTITTGACGPSSLCWWWPAP